MPETKMTPLREQLHILEVRTVDNKSFIPQTALERVLTESAVEEVLSSPKFKKDFYKRNELAQLILKGGKRLLGVLILIQREDAILKFLQMDQLQALELDSRLPLKLDENLRSILESDAEEFYELQWKFLAPILRKDRSHRVFEDTKTILPFVGSEHLTRGGFGDISKVMLHPVHQRLVNLGIDGDAVVIRKKIRVENSSGDCTNNEEERILASLRALKHPNIIALLASYTYGGVHNLLFPVADDDLDALLRGKVPRTPNFRHDHIILREAHGLSSAIETIHTFFVGEYDLNMIGCHYDLKPKNILVKHDKFLVTDFGLSRLELPDTGSERSQVRVQGFYYAPECQSNLKGFKKSSVGKEADVWSFGCILSMIIVFLEGGPEGVAAFEQSRRIETNVPNCGRFVTRSFHANGQLNPAVQDCLERIKRVSQSACLRETVLLIQKLLNVDPNARPPISIITRELSFIAQKSAFEFSCDRFQHLRHTLSSSKPIKLEMESSRFKIWGETAGFTGKYDEIQKDVRTRLQEFSSGITETLSEIEDELQFIESWSIRSLSPTYFRLATLNTKLWSYLPSQLFDEMNVMLQSVMLQGKTREELWDISNTFQSNMAPEYSNIGALAEFTNLTAGAYGNSSSDDREELLLQSSDVSVVSEFDLHSLGTTKLSADTESSAALIEWITYEAHWDEKLFGRVPKIARLFSKSSKVERSGLQVLRCKGYYHDKPHKRFGLVYEIPTLDPNPVTLRHLIKNTTERSERPTLGDLFELARRIVRCVLEVHKVGWLHKSISSYNIFFLPTTTPGLKHLPITLPHLIGFNHSRSDNRQTFTEGLVGENQRQYHHPAYLQDDHGFRAEYDYYSVGLILLEIGRWRTLSQITKRMRKFTLDQRSKELVNECMDNLGNSMGDHYRDAVKACLTSGFSGGDGIRNEFEVEVVARLAKCQA